ncbi:ubiquinol-cytochrome c reductase cytochrome c subunit [Tessaracoccus bendigoensis DSM 12906]|uniref:Cytochrome bc1 complex cytochrome c subunit n=1 Tax=Tessaracoccus bendigoensis DSM 12906 TaxID=1123357 RepID=A0A1M6AUA1_9ACTN|nr:c-type cytochrome [Tessaracoccus bendigoensis]SHI39997.1 ubiquinol-cytochrome c reductase cytochrome c subunit [Tessaracoccus bendigoensis DSM 12906]
MKLLTKFRRHSLARPALLILALVVVGLGYAGVNPQRSSAETETTQQVEQGKALFDLTCSSCHGLGAEGTSQGPTLIGVGAAAVDFQMGTGRMPAARREAQLPVREVNYSQEQIEAVAAYVASLGAGPAIPSSEQYSPEGLSDDEIARGGSLFRANCSACHGITGGGGAMPNGKFAPSLVDTSSRHIYEAMRTGPQQMPTFSKDVMPDQSVREIIGYLEDANGQPNHGGLTMGDAGPVSEGLWVFIIGIGGLSVVATWIAKKGARAR